MSFHEECLVRAESIWNAMLRHRFLKETAEGLIGDAVFGNWMQQDYLFVEEGVRFIAVLCSRAPLSIARPLTSAIPALQAELELFESMASQKKISFQNLKTTPTCHAYVQFMLATAHSASFEEGFALLYGAEKAYFDSWLWVRQNLTHESPWLPFIERWSSDAFREWVSWIEVTLDGLADHSSPSLKEKMIEVFLLTGQYELRFWDMAFQGESWPALGR
jgi:thiaminase